eukprot:210653-Rhodomonas_salina.1
MAGPTPSTGTSRACVVSALPTRYPAGILPHALFRFTPCHHPSIHPAASSSLLDRCSSMQCG